MKQNCRLKIINDVLDLTGKVTSGKPTYNYNRDQRYVEVNFGPNLKKVKTYEQAVEVAKSRAYAWNKKINGKRFLDNIFEAVENFIQIKISNKFINGKLKDPDFENSEQAYKNYIENTPGNETIDLYGRMSKAELEEMRISEQALRDQGDYFFQQDNAVTYNFKGAQKILDNMSKIDNWSKQIKDPEVLFNKIQKDLGIPKNQLDLIKDSEGNTIKDKVISFMSNYSYTVEINRTINDASEMDFNKPDEIGTFKPTSYHSNLTVPGGTNYTENAFETPLIYPSIIPSETHKPFNTKHNIGWFRSDDLNADTFIEGRDDAFNPKTRRILELQSDLFQKGRNIFSLIKNLDLAAEQGLNLEEIQEFLPNELRQNQFLQLLNKDNNWVTFFVKSIIQDSAKKGYEKVLFPSGNTASKIERHTTLEEFKKEKENKIKELESEKSYIEKEENSWVVRSYKNGFQNSFKDEKSALNLQERNNKYFDNEINQLKQELERVEGPEGFGALKPIYNFYETVVANVLKKQGYNSRVITDEYGNTWNEVTIDRVRDTSPIYFQQKNKIKPGVSELFESNPELANSVYEALGFGNNLPLAVNKEIEFLLHTEKLKINLQDITLEEEGNVDLNSKDKWNTFAIKAKGKKLGYIQVKYKDDNTVKIGLSALYEGKEEVKQSIISKILDLINNLFKTKKVEISDKKINVNAGKGVGKLAYELLAVKLKREYQKDLLSDTTRSDYAENLWKSFEKQGKASVIGKTDTQYRWDYYYKFNVDNQITPQQKQQAQQLYSQYLDTGKQDIEGFKEFVLKNKLSKSDIKFQNKTEATKKNPIEGLNERLISALQSIGVKVEFVNSLKNRFSNDPVAVFDSVNKLILIAKNKANVTTLPEEAFHAIVDAFEDHPFIQRLMDLASKTDYKSILGEEYVQLYKNNKTKLKKEIIGKWLAGVATNTYEGAERTKSILRQFWDFILSKFGKVSDKYQQEFNTELQNALNQVVESTLKGELPTNYSGYTPKDGVFFQTKSSKKSKDTKDKKQNIQSKLLEQEIYFKRRKAKLEDWLKKNPQDHPARPARILEYDSVVKALAQYEDLGTGAGFVETGEIILNNIDNFLRRLETDSLKTYLSRDMDDDLLYTLNTLDVFSRLPSLEGRANKLRDKFNEYAIEYTMLQVNKFRNVGEELTWEDVLGQNVDINLYRRYFGALADVQDYLGSTIGVLIKRAQNRASTNNQKLASETSEWAKKLSDWGKANGKSYDDVMQLFVQVVDDKAILAKPWSTKFYNDLATHANKKDGWYAANAIKTKEGWVPVDKTKYANPQYAYIMKTPVLKEFYNYYQSSLESFGTKLPRQVNKNMIPNLLKNTLSDIIQSDKSTLSKASELVSKVLNIGNYYEDGLIIHDKFKNDVIPLKYFKNITPDKKNLDLVQALYKFGEFANEYDELSDVLPKTRLIQRVMSTKQYIKSNDPKGAISGSETKIFQLADDYIKMQVLGEMKADEGVKLKVGEIQDNEGKTIGSKTISTSDIIDKFLGYNSLLRIGFNPFNALTNALVGETGNLIEAAGGRYYDVSGLNKATKIFTTQNFSEKSKMNKILEKFNPLQELTEYSHATNVSKNKLTKEKFMDIMYSPQRAGEKFLQSRTMVAMMFKEKMPDGKDMWEAFDDNGELKAEYRKNMTNEQYQEFIDKFSDKVQRVNQMIHGRYSQRDASAAQQWVLMRMILQFKKWIPAAYESRLGKRQYDPRLRDEVEGRYLTGARILRDALKGDLGRLKAGNMTPLELYNMRKNLMEAVLILATYGLYLLMGWGDDEEKKRSASYKFFIDQADRVSGDLLYWYNPAQINRTVKSPISLTTTVSDAVGAITELPFVFGEDAEYKRGERKGENKFVSKTMNLIPLVKPTADFVRLFNKEKYVEYEPR